MLKVYDFTRIEQRLQGLAADVAAWRAVRAHRARHPEGRDAHAWSSWRRTRTAAFRRSSSRTARSSLRVGCRSSGTSPKARRSPLQTGWRAQRRCNGCSSSSTATSPISPWRASGSTSSTKLTPQQESQPAGHHEEGLCRARRDGEASRDPHRSSSTSATASPTSRSTPTRMSPTRARSTCRAIRTSPPGWRA